MLKKLAPLLILSILVTGCFSSSKLFLVGDVPKADYTSEISFSRTLNLIIVEIEMGGEPRRFLFDTGAPMVVSEELAEEFDMKVVTKSDVKDSNGQRKRQEYVKMPAFTLGYQQFGGFTAIVVDLDYSPVIACLEIDGILGANMMRTAFWKIDYEHEKIYFSNYDEFLPEGDAIVLPFRTKSTFTPVVDLTVDSLTIKNITFDTGSGSGLSISQNLLPPFNAESDAVYPSYGYQTSGIFGTVADTGYYMQKPITVGKSVIPNMLLTVHRRNGKGLLGTAFFDDFDVVLNWKRKRAFLIQRNDSVEMKMNSFGFTLVKQNDQLIVGSVVLGEQADKAGLAFTDRVLKINDIDCSKVSGVQFCRIRSILDETEDPVTITIAKKGTFTLEKQKYF